MPLSHFEWQYHIICRKKWQQTVDHSLCEFKVLYLNEHFTKCWKERRGLNKCTVLVYYAAWRIKILVLTKKNHGSKYSLKKNTVKDFLWGGMPDNSSQCHTVLPLRFIYWNKVLLLRFSCIAKCWESCPIL